MMPEQEDGPWPSPVGPFANSAAASAAKIAIVATKQMFCQYLHSWAVGRPGDTERIGPAHYPELLINGIAPQVDPR